MVKTTTLLPREIPILEIKTVKYDKVLHDDYHKHTSDKHQLLQTHSSTDKQGNQAANDSSLTIYMNMTRDHH